MERGEPYYFDILNRVDESSLSFYSRRKNTTKLKLQINHNKESLSNEINYYTGLRKFTSYGNVCTYTLLMFNEIGPTPHTENEPRVESHVRVPGVHGFPRSDCPKINT